MPTFTKHEGGILFDGSLGTEPWTGFVVYASDTFNATHGHPAVVMQNATTSWVKIGRGYPTLNLGVCREDANTGNRLSVGCGGHVTYLKFYNTVAEDDFILGSASTFSWAIDTGFAMSTSSHIGKGYICGIAKEAKTTIGWDTVRCWMSPWRI